MRVPAIYETSRGEPTDENPLGQPVSTVTDYGRDLGVGYVEGDTSLAVSTNSDYTANNFPANVNGVATTYAWTKTDTTTGTTLTNNTARVCNLAANATGGSCVLQVVATNAQADNSPHTETLTITVA